jgi:hypothetical protein
VGLDKGFDSRSLAVASLTLPLQFYPSQAARLTLGDTILRRLKASGTIGDGVIGSPPPDIGSRSRAHMVIDGDAVPSPEIDIASLRVQPAYFSTVGIRLVRGRGFDTDDPETNVIVSEHFARRFWPGGGAVGHTFRGDPDSQLCHVVGVVSDVRNQYDLPDGMSAHDFQYYQPLQRPAPMPPGRPPVADSGGSYGFINLTLRLDSPDKIPSILPLIRQIDPRAPVALAFVDEEYAERYADRLLATRVIGAFGALAFIVAAAGIYGLMAFLVATRRREIGIRMALGADRSSIRRLVLNSALRLVVAGIVVGAVAGLVGSRWIASQLFRVRPTDPATWLGVTLSVVAIALFATWYPARTAARVDPSRLLRD